jgi:hypothetical protein
MFEVIAVEPRRWRRSLLKLRCVAAIDAQKAGRTFEGYGSYSHQHYRLIVPLGATYTLTAHRREMLGIGDRLSVDQMDARGAFRGEWQMM